MLRKKPRIEGAMQAMHQWPKCETAQQCIVKRMRWLYCRASLANNIIHADHDTGYCGHVRMTVGRNEGFCGWLRRD